MITVVELKWQSQEDGEDVVEVVSLQSPNMGNNVEWKGKTCHELFKSGK